ncbi:hypothetical protein [Dictyobacter arantiisoli]|uniref:Uncharacterized protein n=1 Tax=Dictyobacter arantiisoli TaxID=2014874 RepID=A0A5A5TL40_9CHLR|nr:hypothetical protein [Dictyobacter arantiisoli]GCF12042.1 hypothetical protein KDI_56060 [Dictyobacter arantiisoli]
MQGPEYKDIQQLEELVKAMQWENVSFVPDERNIIAIDQEISTEWLQTLESV